MEGALPGTQAVGTEEPLLVQLANLTIHVAFMQMNKTISGEMAESKSHKRDAAFLAPRYQA